MKVQNKSKNLKKKTNIKPIEPIEPIENIGDFIEDTKPTNPLDIIVDELDILADAIPTNEIINGVVVCASCNNSVNSYNTWCTYKKCHMCRECKNKPEQKSNPNTSTTIYNICKCGIDTDNICSCDFPKWQTNKANNKIFCLACDKWKCRCGTI